MRSAKTQDERLKLRDEHRAEMQKRARDQGVPLPEPRGPRAAKAPAPAGAPGAGPAARRSQLYGDELFTPEERRAFFDKMKAAQNAGGAREAPGRTPGDRRCRAKEKGITLTEPGPGAPKAQ